MLEQSLVAFGGVVEDASGFGEHRISAPAEVSECEFQWCEPGQQRGFEVPESLGSFDQGVSDQDDAVVVLELETRLR